MGLEAHQIVHALGGVVLPQLHHGVRLMTSGGIFQPNGLHGAVAQGIHAPPRHDLHGHTTFKDVFVLKAMHRGFLGICQFPDEGFVLLSIHGAVDVIGRSPVVPGLPPGKIHVDGLRRNQRCRSVKKVQIPGLPEVMPDGLAERVGGQRPRGHDHRPFGNLGDFFGNHRDIGVIPDFLRDHSGKAAPVNCQAAACLHSRGIGAGKNQAAAAAQLLFQKPHGVFQPVAPQGIGADKLGKIRAVVGGGHLLRLHFGKLYLDAPVCQLPSRFASGQPRADDFYLHALLSFLEDVFAVLFAVVLAAVFFTAVFFAAVFFAAVFFAAVFFSAGFSSGADSPSSVVFFL